MSEEVVSMELPAPLGWKKQYFPKRGGTPRKNEIVFTAPTGEEIHNQRQLQQYLKAHPDAPPASEFDWGTGETPRRSARISEKTKAVSPAESEPTKKKGRRSSAAKKDNKENKTADEETKTEVEMKDAEKDEEEKTEHGDEKDAQMEEAGKTEEEKAEHGDEKDAQMEEAGKTEEEKTEHGDEKDAQLEEAGKTEEEKTAGGDEKDAQIQESDETKEKEPDSLKEVAKENQDENKDTSTETKDSVSEGGKKDTSTETKDSVFLDAKSEKDASVPQAEGKKEAEDKDAEVKTGEQPQVPVDTKDVPEEQVKSDAEGGKKEPTEIDGGVIPSFVTSHETDPVQMENPQEKEQPLSDAVKKDSLEEPVKPDVAVNAEAKVHFDGGAKDDGTDPGLVQEPKSEINTKPVEVSENGTQAG